MNLKSIYLAATSALVVSLAVVGLSGSSISTSKSIALASAAKQSKNSNWTKVLAAAKQGTIDLRNKSSAKPWLLINFQENDGYYGGNNYIKSEILDQNNSPIGIDFLLSNLANPPIVSGNLVLFIFEKSIGVWQTQNQGFKLAETGIVSKYLMGRKNLYILTKEEINDNSCQLYEFNPLTLTKRLVLSDRDFQNEELASSLCDNKTNLTYTDDSSIWTLWGHGSSGGLDVYYTQFDLKTGKLIKSVALAENKAQGHITNLEVDVSQKIPALQEKKSVIYTCDKQPSNCLGADSELSSKLYSMAQKAVEKNVPYLAEKRNSFTKNSVIECGNFKYSETNKLSDHRIFANSSIQTSNQLLFQNRPVEKYRDISAYKKVECIK